MGYLTYRERIVIEALVKRKTPVKEIAAHLGRCFSTIYKELKKGRVVLVDTHLKEYISYSADVAQQKHDYAQTNKGIQLKIGSDHGYAAYIEHKIKVDHFSPAAALAAARNSDQFTTDISVGTLYNYIHSGVLAVSAGDLLRAAGKKKKKDPLTPPKVLEAPSIDDRPDYINDRSELGHWEMDCVCSKQGKKPALLVLTERASRHELMFKMMNKEMASVVRVLDKLERRLGSERFRSTFRSITVDNGSEFRDYRGMTRSINGGSRTEVYYCHPYRSGERGSNENCNAIIRRWFPKGTDFTKISQKEIYRVQTWINNYPRKVLGWCCAADFGITI